MRTKHTLMFHILISLLLTNFALVASKYTKERMEYLKRKLTKRINLENFDRESNQYKPFKNYLKEEAYIIKYDSAKIAQIISDLGVPETYDFFNATGCKKVIKDQQRCGCCWSHAATTSLAYRYFVEGVDVNLSPQDGLSCYIRDCDIGNYLIDPALNLVKNGTVTEGCLPFSSGDGKSMEACPTSCKDGTPFKKYYAREVFMTEDFYSEENFYDIVSIMMYQIVNHGPIVTGFQVFDDFMTWSDDKYKERCINEAYSYDGESSFAGGHAVTIVGYGKAKGKYYWLIQNSWGEEVCDNGLYKIEMGQVGVEMVAFEEPYIAPGGETVEVPVAFDYIDEFCTLYVNSLDPNANWFDVLEVSFSSPKSKDRDFNYQCSAVDLPEGKKAACYFEYYNTEIMNKGTYSFSSARALGSKNVFSFDDNSANFEFFGGNVVSYLYLQTVYISGEGSSILLYHDFFYGIESNVPPIYANINSTKALSNCTPLNFGSEFPVINCILKKEELDDFDYMITPTDTPVVYGTLCGYKETTELVALRLDTSKYPVYYLKNIAVPRNGVVYSDTYLTLTMEVSGSLKAKVENNVFYTFIEVERNKRNETYLMGCYTGYPEKVGEEFETQCQIEMEESQIYVRFDELYVLPVYFPYKTKTPYDLIIKDIIKADKSNSPEPEPLGANLIKNSYLLVLLASLILF